MGLGLSGVRLSLELYSRRLYGGFDAVMDLGAQDLLLSRPALMRCFAAAGISADPGSFARLDKLPSSRMSAEHFYRAIGFKRYACMDIGGGLSGIELSRRSELAPNNMRWNALKQDLNLPLAYPDLAEKFDVVTDYGNNEHVFNVIQAYRTQHDLCRPGGLLIVQQQVYDGNGYYCFNPSFYETLAAANDYEIIFSAYEFNNQFVPVEIDIESILHREVPLGLAYIMRKNHSAPFRVPTQRDSGRTSRRASRFTIPRLPDDTPRAFVPLISDSGAAGIGGRDALRALVSRFKAFADLSSRRDS